MVGTWGFSNFYFKYTFKVFLNSGLGWRLKAGIPIIAKHRKGRELYQKVVHFV